MTLCRPAQRLRPCAAKYGGCSGEGKRRYTSGRHEAKFARPEDDQRDMASHIFSSSFSSYHLCRQTSGFILASLTRTATLCATDIQGMLGTSFSMC